MNFVRDEVTMEQMRVAEAQRQVEKECARTFQIQEEVERRVREEKAAVRAEADRLAQESAAVARAKRECDQTASK